MRGRDTVRDQKRLLSIIAVGVGIVIFLTGVTGVYTIVTPCGVIGVCPPPYNYDYDYLAILIGVTLSAIGSFVYVHHK